MLLRQATGKCFIRIKHLFHTRKGINIVNFSLQIIKWQMNRSHTGNPVPVESGFLPTACIWSHNHPRSSSQYLHTSMSQITSVKISAKIMFGCPKVTRMPTDYCSPVTTTLNRYAAISHSKVSLRIRFRSETFIRQNFSHTPLFLIAKLRHIFRIFSCRRCTGYQAKISCCHISIKISLSIGRTGKSHHCILHRNKFSLSIRMTSGHR